LRVRFATSYIAPVDPTRFAGGFSPYLDRTSNWIHQKLRSVNFLPGKSANEFICAARFVDFRESQPGELKGVLHVERRIDGTFLGWSTVWKQHRARLAG
jgi:hypothetical protein